MSASEAPRFGALANVELNAVMRGRPFPIERLDEVLANGMPWVPSNICISACNTIPPDNPFGPVGETRFVAIPGPPMVMPAREDRPAMALYLAELRQHDGTFWEGCGRSQLARTLAEFETQYGLRLRVGFEHECYISRLDDGPTGAYSISGSRRASGLAAEVQATLATAGTRLEQFIAEFGVDQFEVSTPVREALVAADHAVLMREAIRDAARSRGGHATFAPKPDLTQAGSGVHIHFSLWSTAGEPVTAHGGALTDTGAAFAAGILKHLEAVMAYTTPSPNSFQRISESAWVGVFACFGVRNREAALRLCPRDPAPDGGNPGASLEFRLCDGASNPYLALAALVRAGMLGLSESLPAPESVEIDPARIAPATREARGYRRVPHTLEACLDAAAPHAASWFGELFWKAYGSARRNEINDALLAGDDYPARLSRIV